MFAGHNKYVLHHSRYKVLCLQATTNISSSPAHTKSYVFSPQQIWPPDLFTNLYTKYYNFQHAVTNMSWSSMGAPCIHYIWNPALCTNTYTKYSKCMHAITNMSSSQVGTRYCVCRPIQIYPPAQYIQGSVFAVHTNMSTGLEDIFVVACRHNTLYYRSGGRIVRRSTCIHMLTGNRYLKGLSLQLRVKKRALPVMPGLQTKEPALANEPCSKPYTSDTWWNTVSREFVAVGRRGGDGLYL